MFKRDEANSLVDRTHFLCSNNTSSNWAEANVYKSCNSLSSIKNSIQNDKAFERDQKKEKSYFCKEELLNYKPKNSHKYSSCRPSTAVKRHVKKISQDFSITQINFKSGSNSNGIILQIESSNTKKIDAKDASKFNPFLCSRSSGKKFIQSDSLCSKCSSSKYQIIPSLMSPSITPASHNNPSTSTESKMTQEASNSSPRDLSKQKTYSFSSSVAQTIAKQRKLQIERLSSARLIRKRRSLSANAGFPHGILKVPFEQVKKAKVYTERAVREGKVFAIYGAFPAIREALLKRGWVEKVLHTIPYVNPHPQNCVCTHVGWHIHHSSHSQSSNQSGLSLSPNHSDNQLCSSDDVSEDAAQRDSSASDSTGYDIEMLKEENLNSCFDLTTNISSSQEVTVSSKNIEESVVSTEENCIREENDHIQQSQSILREENKKIVETKEIKENDEEAEYIRKLTRTLNTAFLAPSDIREGIHKSINNKNLPIFQYSIPPYERKPSSQSLKKNNELKELPENDSDQNKDTDEIFKNKGNESTLDNFEYSTNGDEESDFESQNKYENERETTVKPFNPYPELDYVLTNLDKPVVARVLRNVEPNFIWSWNRDSISFKHLSKEQLVNRFPNTPFTTKYGLCETLQQLHWFSEADCVDTFVPRGYCIGHEDERSAFIHDYRTTACLNILKWVTEGSQEKGLQSVVHPMGEVPIRRVRQSLQHVERFIESCCHDDLDSPPICPLKEHEWELILNAHHRIIHQGKKIKALPHHGETLLKDCHSALERVEPFWPQLGMDGLRNVWIVKPGAQSRGRGIFLLNNLEDILALVQSPLIYQTKYVVQKYMERPLLIHNTKFDIRQWFLVTDWNPLTLWMYKESYLRFCSQQYDLTNNDESIHLSNNAIQCKYLNGERDKELPEENMWDCHQFKEYLRNQGQEDTYDRVIYPGMKGALIATMLAAQVQMDSFKHGFEFFGADFMLTQDYRPWLIEINSSPCMAATTSVTKRMCHESLNDTIKVVVDYRQSKAADTGKFELIYQDKEKSVASLPYYGVTLQVVGRQIWKPKQDKRKVKKIRPLPKVVKSLPLVALHLEESGELSASKNCPTFLNCQNFSHDGPTLTTIVPSTITSKSQQSVGHTNQYEKRAGKI